MPFRRFEKAIHDTTAEGATKTGGRKRGATMRKEAPSFASWVPWIRSVMRRSRAGCERRLVTSTSTASPSWVVVVARPQALLDLVVELAEGSARLDRIEGERPSPVVIGVDDRLAPAARREGLRSDRVVPGDGVQHPDRLLSRDETVGEDSDRVEMVWV